MFQTLFSPLCIGGLELKNRVVFAPTTMGSSGQARRERLLNVARGDTALVTLGDIGVEQLFHKDGFDLATEEGRAECRGLVQELHDLGCKVCAQVFAPDYDTAGFVARMHDPAVSREELRDFMYGHVDRYVTEMPLERVHQIVDLFGQRAAQAREAGFDMVQIHGDRLVGSFSSANYNRRADEFGPSSPRGLVAFGRAVVESVRAAVGEGYPIEYKLAVRQPERGLGLTGLSLAEVPSFVAGLEASGVNAFHVTGANHSNLEDTVPSARHDELKGEGCFRNLAAAVSRVATVPVTAVGKIHTPEYAEDLLASGDAQLVAMSRQLLADPAWVQKASRGDVAGITRCVYCNRKCVGSLRTHSEFGCVFDGR